MRAEDVYYKKGTEADHSFALARLNEIMDILDVTNVTKVILTVTLRMAIDDAYLQGQEDAHG